MIREREWKTRSRFTPFEQYFFSFTAGSEKDTLHMTAVGHYPDKMHHELVPSNSDDSEWIFPDQEITRVLVEKFRKVSEVKSICAQLGPEEITIWTLLGSYDRSAREKVYAMELEICQTFHLYDFDFRVSAVDLISSEELIRAGAHEIYRRP